MLQMIRDGTLGIQQGDGLEQILSRERGLVVEVGMAHYRTARIYNGGSVAASGNLEGGCCTGSYASDVANRLKGWVDAPKAFP